MCFGCPSVATRVGGIPEVIEDNVSGLLVPLETPDKLARAVETLIQDPTLRANSGSTPPMRVRVKSFPPTRLCRVMKRFIAASMVASIVKA